MEEEYEDDRRTLGRRRKRQKKMRIRMRGRRQRRRIRIKRIAHICIYSNSPIVSLNFEPGLLSGLQGQPVKLSDLTYYQQT